MAIDDGQRQTFEALEVTMANDMQHIFGQLIWLIPHDKQSQCKLGGVVVFTSTADIHKNFAHWHNLHHNALCLRSDHVTMTLEACLLNVPPNSDGLPVHSQLSMHKLNYPPQAGDRHFSIGSAIPLPAIDDREAWTSRGGLAAGHFHVMFADAKP